MPLESTIVKGIQDYLNNLPSCKVIKIHGSIYIESGTPDILGCLAGRMLALEAKQPGEQPTKLQQKRMIEWKAAGAIVGVVTSIDDVRQLLTKTANGDNITSRLIES